MFEKVDQFKYLWATIEGNNYWIFWNNKQNWNFFNPNYFQEKFTTVYTCSWTKADEWIRCLDDDSTNKKKLL